MNRQDVINLVKGMLHPISPAGCELESNLIFCEVDIAQMHLRLG